MSIRVCDPTPQDRLIRRNIYRSSILVRGKEDQEDKEARRVTRDENRNDVSCLSMNRNKAELPVPEDVEKSRNPSYLRFALTATYVCCRARNMLVVPCGTA
jgi:hypothetical protein